MTNANVLTTEKLEGLLEVKEVVAQTVIEKVIEAPAKETKKSNKAKKPVAIVRVPSVGQTLLRVEGTDTKEYEFKDIFESVDDMEYVCLVPRKNRKDDCIPLQAFYEKVERIGTEGRQKGCKYIYTPVKKDNCIMMEKFNQDNSRCNTVVYKYK